MYNKEQKNDENFWISYADLMAGLLFVFILVIGAIVIKYVYTQNTLEKEKAALNSSENEKAKLFEQLAKTRSELDKTNVDLKEKANTISLNNVEIEKLKALLLDYELKTKEQNEKNEKIVLELTNKDTVIKLKEDELALLAEKLLTQTKEHQKLVEEFDITKAKIKSLTGIKLNVIAKLKEKLGKSINIDEKSGAIKFSSNILFDQNQYQLKEDAKKELSKTLKKYLSTLLDDKDMRKYIESITIEGHTNSDGSYISNLQLSQQRAYAVMQFLYDSNIIDKKLLGNYVNSSGRSSADLIIDEKGIEDKDASRRIEIKFTIKNEEAVRELQNYLGEKK